MSAARKRGSRLSALHVRLHPRPAASLAAMGPRKSRGERQRRMIISGGKQKNGRAQKIPGAFLFENWPKRACGVKGSNFEATPGGFICSGGLAGRKF